MSDDITTDAGRTSLLRHLFLTPQGWGALVTILVAGAGIVLYVFGMINVPERLTKAEAAVTRAEGAVKTVQHQHHNMNRNMTWLICVNPDASPDRLILLGVDCRNLPDGTLPREDGP